MNLLQAIKIARREWAYDGPKRTGLYRESTFRRAVSRWNRAINRGLATRRRLRTGDDNPCPHSKPG